MEVREPSARYLAKSAYKQTEVGVIPEDWHVSTVGDEFTIQLGKMLDAEKNAGVAKPFLGNRAVQWGRIDVSDLGEIKLAPQELQRYRLRRGDLLVCEGGEVGRAALWNQALEECYYQKALHRLRPKRGFNVLLMQNLLQSYSASGVLQNYVTQTSIAHLPKDKFETIPIPVPPTEAEQQAIAEALSDADALIESLGQLLAKKRQIKQGAMQTLLQPRDDWNVVALEDIADVIDPHPSHRAPPEEPGGIPFVGIGDLNEEGELIGSRLRTVASSLIAEHRTRYDLGEGLIGLGRVASIGKVVRLKASDQPYVVSPTLGVIQAKCVRIEFLLYALRSQYVVDQFSKIMSGSTRSSVGMVVLRQLKIALPTAEGEQSTIADALSDMDAEIAALETRLAKARLLKQGMMQELLTGRIRLI